ncbi:MAG: hypothetical protein H6656_06295 [Ardenticatenaceae bacterium]|nr:hypothetical protein [Anaerolineales bacterium]MCB9006960.1 hypothetical protein [Ardenticatenaceae bacterium]
MKQVAKELSTPKQPEHPNQSPQNGRRPWQRPQMQRLNLSLDTAMTAGSTDDMVTFRP